MVTSRKFYPACLEDIGGSHNPHELVDEMGEKIRHHSPSRHSVVTMLYREDRSTKKWVMFKRSLEMSSPGGKLNFNSWFG